MPTTTRTPEAETTIAARVVERWKRENPTASVKPEVPFEGRAIDIGMDIDNGDLDIVVVGEAKRTLTRGLFDQLFLSAGVADGVYGIIGRVTNSPEYRTLLAKFKDNKFGLILSDPSGTRELLPAGHQSTIRDVQHDRLRKAIRDCTGQGVAGAVHGQVTKEAAWLREVEREAALDCGLPLRHLNLRTGRFHKSNRLAVGALRNAIREGQTTACIKDYPTETLVEVKR